MKPNFGGLSSSELEYVVTQLVRDNAELIWSAWDDDHMRLAMPLIAHVKVYKHSNVVGFSLLDVNITDTELTGLMEAIDIQGKSLMSSCSDPIRAEPGTPFVLVFVTIDDVPVSVHGCLVRRTIIAGHGE